MQREKGNSKMGLDRLGPRERAQKFGKNLFWKILKKIMFRKYIMSRCRRGDWYI